MKRGTVAMDDQISESSRSIIFRAREKGEQGIGCNQRLSSREASCQRREGEKWGRHRFHSTTVLYHKSESKDFMKIVSFFKISPI